MASFGPFYGTPDKGANQGTRPDGADDAAVPQSTSTKIEPRVTRHEDFQFSDPIHGTK